MLKKINYSRVSEAIKYLSQNFKQQPMLEEVAAHVHLSPFHFQRIFTDWAGISPKKFLQYLTIEALKKEIQITKNLEQVADKVGLSTQSRVYDLFVNIEAVTPQEYKSSGKGIEIDYGFHMTPFGECFIANTKKGICSLSFIDDDKELVLAEFNTKWYNARLTKNQSITGDLVDQLFYSPLYKHQFNLLLKGSKFQLKVWEALLKIPFGTVTTYQNIAKMIDHTGASRVVGTAIGNNPIAFLIPCHRVLRSAVTIGQYHWGVPRKYALIGWEKARLLKLNGID